MEPAFVTNGYFATAFALVFMPALVVLIYLNLKS